MTMRITVIRELSVVVMLLMNEQLSIAFEYLSCYRKGPVDFIVVLVFSLHGVTLITQRVYYLHALVLFAVVIPEIHALRIRVWLKHKHEHS